MGCGRRTKAVQIAEVLLDGVKSGKYDMDGKVLSECVLASRHFVTHLTASNAVGLLGRIGYICKYFGVEFFL